MMCHALAGRSKAMGATLDVGHIASCGYDTVKRFASWPRFENGAFERCALPAAR